MKLNPINQARWQRFKTNRRGYWSMWIFLLVFIMSLGSELIANDKPLVLRYDQRWYTPFLVNYPETTFGGDFKTATDYQDPLIRSNIEQHGWAIWAPIRYSYNSINFATEVPFPSPSSAQHWLGTNENGNDILAQVLYGLRVSILFGLMLTVLSSVIGITVGATQGFYGGKVDLIGQRFIEVWSGMPTLFLIILLSSVVQPTFGGCWR